MIDSAQAGTRVFDSMIVQALRWWGGRHAPIVLHRDGKVSVQDWDLLRAVSPDVVSSLDRLPDDLRAQIDFDLAPAAIQDDGKGLGPFQGPLALPDRRTLEQILPFRHTEELVLISGTGRDDAISSFVDRNFGFYFNLPLPEGVRSRNLSVSTTEQLADALGQLANAPDALAYVSEVAAVPDALPGVEIPSLKSFVVAIGDAIADFCLSWNHLLFCSNRTRIQSVWIPTGLARDLRVGPALGRWIERLCTRARDDRAQISFSSQSIAEAELGELVKNLGISSLRQARVGESTNQGRLISEGLHDLVRSSEVVHRGLQDREVVVLTPPASLHPLSSSGFWAVDLLVEQHSVDGFYIRDHWWQLPKDSATAECFVRPGRIAASTRVPTAIVRDTDKELHLSIPDSEELFSRILCRSVTRRGVRQRFADCRPSDKGRYLISLVDLLGGLGKAAAVLESRYWRMVAKEMPTPSDKDRAWTYGDLLGKAKKEFEEFRRTERRDLTFSRERFAGLVEGFVERGVFIVGTDRKCPGCDSVSWLRLEEFRQLIVCSGCGVSSAFSATQELGVRLNSIVRRAWIQDVVPVLLALGQQVRLARTSFRFAPQTDVFTQKERDEAFTDIDILCTVDGRLVIGEAKQNFEGFGDKDFENLRECAARLRPDRVILFACGGTESSEFAAKVRELDEFFRKMGVAPTEIRKPYKGTLAATLPY